MIHFQSVAPCKASWHRYEIITWYIESCFLLPQGPFVRNKRLQRMNNVPHIYLLHVYHKMHTIFLAKGKSHQERKNYNIFTNKLFFSFLHSYCVHEKNISNMRNIFKVIHQHNIFDKKLLEGHFIFFPLLLFNCKTITMIKTSLCLCCMGGWQETNVVSFNESPMNSQLTCWF